MPRKLSTFFSAASLLLCVAMCLLWVRSYGVSDTLVWGTFDVGRREAWTWRLSASQGDAVLVRQHDAEATDAPPRLGPQANPPRIFQWTSRRPNAQPNWRGFNSSRPWTSLARSEVNLRLAYIAVLAALPPAVLLIMMIRQRLSDRMRAGLCPSCGYDLRATPERCPECGSSKASV